MSKQEVAKLIVDVLDLASKRQEFESSYDEKVVKLSREIKRLYVLNKNKVNDENKYLDFTTAARLAQVEVITEILEKELINDQPLDLTSGQFRKG